MPRSGLRELAATAVAATTLTLLVSCSSDDGAGPSADPSSTSTTSGQRQVRAVKGVVSGRLPKARQTRVVRSVRDVVQHWWRFAYGDVGGSVDLDAAFTVFTKDAAALATKQRAVLSNATVEDATGVVLGKTIATVDVLAPHGHPAGATARVSFLVKTVDDNGDEVATDRIRGQLRLIPQNKKWKVFAFDMERGPRIGGQS